MFKSQEKKFSWDAAAMRSKTRPKDYRERGPGVSAELPEAR